MEQHRLSYVTGATDVAGCVQLVFGHLVRLAAPIMKAYWCDLYTDALWLQGFVRGESVTFYWSLDESGTSIGTDQPLATTREHKYRFTVTIVGGKSTLEIWNITAS